MKQGERRGGKSRGIESIVHAVGSSSGVGEWGEPCKHFLLFCLRTLWNVGVGYPPKRVSGVLSLA